MLVLARLPALLLPLLTLAGMVAALVPPPLPADDPFYKPGFGYQFTPPGTVLKSRSVATAGLGFIPTLSFQTYQLLYRTTAVDGSATATVTTVFVPLNAPKDRFVSYNVFEDSSASQCAPSYNYRLLAQPNNLLVQADLLILQAYLLKGWIVSVADYEGPDSAFGAGRLSGQASLDAARAVQSFQPLGLQRNAKIVGVGYSGGAIASGWSAGLQPTYARDLNIVGWVMGGTPANLTGTFENIDGTLFAGFLLAAINGVKSKTAYPSLQPLIDRVATAKGKEALQFAATHCAVDDILNFAYQSAKDTNFSSLGDQILYEPQVVAVLNDNLMGAKKQETPTAPVYMFHSKMDEVIPFANASALQSTWCNNGATVSFHSLPDAGHLGGAISGLGGAVNFTDDAFNGKVSFKQCEQIAEPSGLGTLPFAIEPLLVGLVNLLEELATADSNVKANPTVLKKTVPTTK